MVGFDVLPPKDLGTPETGTIYGQGCGEFMAQAAKVAGKYAGL